MSSEARGEKNGEEVYPLPGFLILGSAWKGVVSSPSGVRGGAPAETVFIVI